MPTVGVESIRRGSQLLAWTPRKDEIFKPARTTFANFWHGCVDIPRGIATCGVENPRFQCWRLPNPNSKDQVFRSIFSNTKFEYEAPSCRLLLNVQGVGTKVAVHCSPHCRNEMDSTLHFAFLTNGAPPLPKVAAGSLRVNCIPSA